MSARMRHAAHPHTRSALRMVLRGWAQWPCWQAAIAAALLVATGCTRSPIPAEDETLAPAMSSGSAPAMVAASSAQETSTSLPASAEKAANATAEDDSGSVGSSATARDTGIFVRGVVLRGRLEAGPDGVPLAAVVAAFGAPQRRDESMYECSSAFQEGTVEELTWPDFSVETDGVRAVPRSVALTGSNAIRLSDGRTLDVMDVMDVARLRAIFGNRARAIDGGYRTSAASDGNEESAWDFQLGTSGRLTRIDYWIGC